MIQHVWRCGVYGHGNSVESAERNWKQRMTELVNAVHLLVQANDDDCIDARDHLFDVYDEVTTLNQSMESKCNHSFLMGPSSRASLIRSLDGCGAQQVTYFLGARIPVN